MESSEYKRAKYIADETDRNRTTRCGGQTNATTPIDLFVRQYKNGDYGKKMHINTLMFIKSALDKSDEMLAKYKNQPSIVDSLDITHLNYEIQSKTVELLRKADTVAKKEEIVSKMFDEAARWTPIALNVTPSEGLDLWNPTAIRTVVGTALGHTDCQNLWHTCTSNGDLLYVQLRYVKCKAGQRTLYKFSKSESGKIDDYITDYWHPKWVGINTKHGALELKERLLTKGNDECYSTWNWKIGIATCNVTVATANCKDAYVQENNDDIEEIESRHRLTIIKV